MTADDARLKLAEGPGGLGGAGDGFSWLAPARVGVWLLRLAVFAHAVAMFAWVFGGWQTQFGNYLFLELFAPRDGQDFFGFRIDDPYIAAVWVERVMVTAYLLLGTAVLLQPLRRLWLLYVVLVAAAAYGTYRWPVDEGFAVAGFDVSYVWLLALGAGWAMMWWPAALLLGVMFAYAVAESLSATWYGGFRWNEWSIYSDMLRWGTPVVLLTLLTLPGVALLNRFRLALARDLLRLLVATVFFVHGLQAWLGHPGFADLIMGTFNRTFEVQTLLGLNVTSEATAMGIMKAVGLLDFLVASAVLLIPRPVFFPQRIWPIKRGALTRRVTPLLLLWLAFWGLLTATSRVTALGVPEGLSQYPEILLRVSHFLGPLALWGLMATTYRSAADDEIDGMQPTAHDAHAEGPAPVAAGEAGRSGALT